jgi:hypothetical protein
MMTSFIIHYPSGTESATASRLVCYDMPVLANAWQLIATYLSGILTVPLVQRLPGSLIAEARRRWEAKTAARRIIAMQLDPLLKAADELQGKIRSLAEEDFREFRTIPPGVPQRSNLVNLCSTLYLFAQFWARLEILRKESFHADLNRNNQGKVLMRFLRCLESRRVRLVDRAWQRAIGESVMEEGEALLHIRTFKAFVEEYERTPRLQEWIQPLEDVLRQTRLPRTRQRVLQYGVIVQALIDTLDPKHHTTRERPAYPNKLSRRAKREIIGRVFGTYLPDVRQPEKYTGISR